MKKLIITVVFTLTAALTGMTTWAAAIGSGTLNDFSSGNTLSSTDMNTNFTVIKDAVNANSSLQATLPDGVTTNLSFHFVPPEDYLAGGGAVVIGYWSGCEGTDVRLGHSTLGYFVGDNANVINAPVLSTVSVAVASALNYTIFQSVYTVTGGFGTSSYMTFTLGRAGGDVLDTCADSLTLRGVQFRYATCSGFRFLSVPVTTLSR